MNIAEKLKKASSLCINSAEKITTSVSGNWTARRQSFADRAWKKKKRILGYALAFERMSKLAEENKLDKVLSKITSISAIETVHFGCFPLPPNEKDHPEGGWYREEYPTRLKKAQRLGLFSEEEYKKAKKLINELMQAEVSILDERKEKLEKKLVQLRSSNIPGFFPTPTILARELVDYALIEPGMSVLEPSAGIGSLADIIAEKEVDLVCFEIQYSMMEILKLKGHNALLVDFMEAPIRKFNRIVMNPPFEKNQAIEHLLRAYDHFLEQDGVLVAIIPSGSETKMGFIYDQFRKLLNKGTLIKKGQMFNKGDSFRTTGVSVDIFYITKN